MNNLSMSQDERAEGTKDKLVNTTRLQTLRPSPHCKFILKEFNVYVHRARLVIRVDVGHERVTRAVYTFANDATILLLAFGVFVGNMALQRCLRAKYFTAQLASKHFLAVAKPCGIKRGSKRQAGWRL